MAKKRSEPATIPIKAEGATPPPEPSKQRGRPKLANPKPATPILMGIKAGDDYREWFDGVVVPAVGQSAGVDVVDRAFVFDRAMRALVKELGLSNPPRRI